jgi:hypothetical protein
MRNLFRLITCLVFVVVLPASPVSASNDKTIDIGFVGGSGTLGARRGWGVLAGGARLKRYHYGAYGYGIQVGNWFSDPATFFVEGGVGAIVILFPAYAGAGIRMKEGKTVGGQISVAVGAGPLFLVTRGYTEEHRLSAELTLGLVIPIPLFPF